MRRTQIYLDEDQDRRLAERAAAARRTRSDLIREAIDSYLDQPLAEEAKLAEFRAAVKAVAGAKLYFTREYLDLREADQGRAAELERRWHGDRPNEVV